jgi:hypothetical protein
MNLYTFMLLFSAVTSSLFGLFVFAKGWNKKVNLTLALYAQSVALWSFAYFMRETAVAENVLFWTRISHTGAIFIPIFFLHFITYFLDAAGQNRIVLGLGYLVCVWFSILNPTSYFIAGVLPKWDAKLHIVPGPFYILFALFFFTYICYGLFLLFSHYRKTTGLRKTQILYVLLAAVLGFGGGATSFLPTFEINIPTYANSMVFLYTMIAAYAILKHRLMDISFVIRKSLVYSILAGLFTGLYLVLILSVGKLFEGILRSSSVVPAIIVILFVAVGTQP